MSKFSSFVLGKFPQKTTIKFLFLPLTLNRETKWFKKVKILEVFRNGEWQAEKFI